MHNDFLIRVLMFTHFSHIVQAALPKQWKSFDGKYTTVETPYSRHAARLKELYDVVVNSDYLGLDDRLEVLDQIRTTVQVQFTLIKFLEYFVMYFLFVHEFAFHQE